MYGLWLVFPKGFRKWRHICEAHNMINSPATMYEKWHQKVNSKIEINFDRAFKQARIHFMP